MIHSNIFATLSSFSQAIEDGNVNPLRAFIELKNLSDMIFSMQDSIKEAAINEYMKYGKEDLVIDGYKIEKMNGRKIWKYDHSSAWQAANERRKTLEMLMQKAHNGSSIVDGDTGEIIEPAVVTYTSETLKLTKKS
jgi:serine/threonine-protein kinase RIO1